jgi:hypothetical protein
MGAVSITTYGGPEVLKLVDIPEPTPGEGEVTIEVKFSWPARLMLVPSKGKREAALRLGYDDILAAELSTERLL